VVWVIVSGIVIGGAALGSAYLYRRERLTGSTLWIPVAVVLALPVWGFAVGRMMSGTGQPTPAAEPVGGLAAAVSIAWPGMQQAKAPHPAAGGEREAAPVSSLIDGLVKRLEKEPNDGNGWALLAQSYAFIGEQHAAEKATARAIALGIDETTLRERLEQIGDSSSRPSWIDMTLGAE
jgi:hypothetical protein